LVKKDNFYIFINILFRLKVHFSAILVLLFNGFVSHTVFFGVQGWYS